MNQASKLVFQTEKQLKEFGDKIPEDKMAPINEALENLKKAHGAQDVDGCKSGIEALNTAFQAASQEMYSAQQAAGGAEAEPVAMPVLLRMATPKSPMWTLKK